MFAKRQKYGQYEPNKGVSTVLRQYGVHSVTNQDHMNRPIDRTFMLQA